MSINWRQILNKAYWGMFLLAVFAHVPAKATVQVDNIAFGKVATQSSTRGDATASLAVDGNIDGIFNNHSVTHTNFALHNWWHLDLGKNYDVASVHIYNRTDCCSNRLNDFAVFASDRPIEGLSFQQLNDAEDVYSTHITREEKVHKLSVNRTFRYLKIISLKRSYLSVAEVEIYKKNNAKEVGLSGDINWASFANTRAFGLTPTAYLVDGDPHTVWGSKMGHNENVPVKLELPAGVARPLQSYSITTQQIAAYDPKSWTVSGSIDGRSWNRLDTMTDARFDRRGEQYVFELDNDIAYRYYLFKFSGNAQAIRIAELKMCMQQCGENPNRQKRTSQNLAYKAAVSATSEDEKAGFSVGSVVDGLNATKWSSMPEDVDPKVTFALNKSEAKVVRYYFIRSAGMHVNRIPQGWRLEGSNSGINWKVLDERRDTAMGKYETKHYRINNDAAYKFYRVTFTQNNGARQYDVVQIGLCELECGFEANQVHDYAITAHSRLSANDSDITIAALTDGDPETVWRGKRDAMTQTAYVDIATPWLVDARVREYRVTAGKDSRYFPKSWQLQGSLNREDWYTVHSVNGQAFSVGQTHSYRTGTMKSYRYYRFLVNVPDSNNIELAELVLCANGCSQLSPGGKPKSINPERQPMDVQSTGMERDYEASEISWKFVSNSVNALEFYTSNSQVQTIGSYSLASSSATGEKFSWTVWALDQNDNWQLVGVRSNESLTATPRTFSTALLSPVKAFKLEFLNDDDAMLSHASVCTDFDCGYADVAVPDRTQWKMWSKAPAERFTDATLLGNGPLGVSVYGGVSSENFLLNEHQIWSGSPYQAGKIISDSVREEFKEAVYNQDYVTVNNLHRRNFLDRAPTHYQLAGFLKAQTGLSTRAFGYSRSFDIESGVATVRFTGENGAQYERATFASFSDPVIVSKFKVTDGVQNLRFNFDSPMKNVRVSGRNRTPISAEIILDGMGTDDGALEGKVAYRVHAIIRANNGRIKYEDEAVAVMGSSDVDVIIAIDTNVSNYRTLNGDPAALTRQQLSSGFVRNSFNQLLQRHLSPYRSKMGRVQFELPASQNDTKPTMERLKDARSAKDFNTAAMWMQFSRYLLLASSMNSEPSNLQGRWNPSVWPMWWSDYHLNINFQMNYSIALNLNITEATDPMVYFIRDLAKEGQRLARDMYGVNNGGWVAHVTADLWRQSPPVRGAWVQWVQGGNWVSQLVWDRHDYMREPNFLRRHVYPILKGNALFFDAILEQHRDANDNHLVHMYSNSPENRPVVNGVAHDGNYVQVMPTMDTQLLHELYEHVIALSAELNVDADLRAKWKVTKSLLPNPSPIGSWGQIKEWYVELDRPNDRHRHVSHLYGAAPGYIMDLDNKAIRDAVRTSLANRAGGTGWAKPWKSQIYARLGDAESAATWVYSAIGGSYQNYMIPTSYYPQVDGVFGSAAAFSEMLVQSRRGQISLLSALPKSWPTGAIKGIRARGGFIIKDLSWQDGHLKRARIYSALGGTLTVKNNGKVSSMNTFPGQYVEIDGDLRMY